MHKQGNPLRDRADALSRLSIPGPRVMATLLTISSFLLVLLVTFVGLIWIFQERIAFQPPPTTIAPLPEADGVQRVTYVAKDGQSLLAYVVGDPAAAKGLLICFHGNADLAAHAIPWAEHVARVSGFAVMLAEYRGYMGLGGRPSYLTSQLDSEAAYAFARDSLHLTPDRMAFYGHSLGSAIAVELASRYRPSVLILESPFTSARAMGRVIGWRPVEIAWSAISRFHFDTPARVARLESPVWVAHGARDRLVPPQMGRDVFAAAKVKGQLLLVSNASHNDVAGSGGADYWRWIESALK